MSLQTTLYHSLLRMTALTLAIVLLFVSGFVHPVTKIFTQNTTQYLASAVGASASVEYTELNQITAALTKQQAELDAREASITEREISIGLAPGSSAKSGDTATLITSALLFVILVLIVLNYILDYMRARPVVLGKT